VWVAGIVPSLTRAMPGRFRDELLMIKRYKKYTFTLLTNLTGASPDLESGTNNRWRVE